MKNNKKGFTLAELLIVVAIIAVLVAISIPTFSSKLETAREAVDAANIRAKYAEVCANAISEPEKDIMETVKLTQQIDEWQLDALELGSIGGVQIKADPAKGILGINAGKGDSVAIVYKSRNGSITIGGVLTSG